VRISHLRVTSEKRCYLIAVDTKPSRKIGEASLLFADTRRDKLKQFSGCKSLNLLTFRDAR